MIQPWIPYAGAALAALGVAAAIFLQLGRSDSLLRRGWTRYLRAITAELKFLMIKTPPVRFAAIHAGAVAVLLFAAAAARSLTIGFLVPVAAIAPLLVLARRRERRVRDIESLLNVWLLAVANALKSTPSIGEAIRASSALVRAPLSQELDLALKELKLGVPMDEALFNMSERVRSPAFASVITTLLVARRTGGQLPAVLERSAATLREMERLEGVVRSKTAEGKSQSYVLAAVPFALCGALHMMDPEWLPQLTQNMIGYLILSASIGLWIGSILVARKVLSVDI